MISFSLIFSVCLVAAGLIIGLLSGIFGVGGGFLLTPALKIFFDVPYNVSVGSSLAVITIISLVGVLRHHKMSHINIKLGLIVLSGIIPGVEIGAHLLVRLKQSGMMDNILNVSFLLVFILAFVIMLIEYLKWTNGEKESVDLEKYTINYHWFDKKENSLNIFALVLTGFIIGIMQGLLGVGGGFVMLPVLISIFCIPARIVVGTCLFIILPSSFFGSISHVFKGNVNFMLVGLILCGSIAGTFIGSAFTEKIKGKKIRFYFLFIILLAIAMMIFQLFVSGCAGH